MDSALGILARSQGRKEETRWDSPVDAAIALMGSGGFRRLPVVNQGGKLVGILSLDDVLKLLVEELAHMGRILEKESPPRKVRVGAAKTQK
jgi:CBS domain containing-hemolysin-like protein